MPPAGGWLEWPAQGCSACVQGLEPLHVVCGCVRVGGRVGGWWVGGGLLAPAVARANLGNNQGPGGLKHRAITSPMPWPSGLHPSGLRQAGPPSGGGASSFNALGRNPQQWERGFQRRGLKLLSGGRRSDDKQSGKTGTCCVPHEFERLWVAVVCVGGCLGCGLLAGLVGGFGGVGLLLTLPRALPHWWLWRCAGSHRLRSPSACCTPPLLLHRGWQHALSFDQVCITHNQGESGVEAASVGNTEREGANA